MKTSRIQNFFPNTFGYDSKIILPEELYTDARRFETLGQRSDPSLMCLLTTAEIMGNIGFQAIEDRVRYLGTIVYDGFQAFPNFPMTTPANEAQRIGVIIAGVDPTVSQLISRIKQYRGCQVGKFGEHGWEGVNYSVFGNSTTAKTFSAYHYRNRDPELLLILLYFL